MGERHDESPAPPAMRTSGGTPPPIGSLLSTITEAVEQYQQASTEQLAAVQLAAQRSFDARVAELSQLGEWRMRTLQDRLDLAESQLADIDDRVAHLVAPVLEQARRSAEQTARLAERVDTLDQRTAALVGWADGLDDRLSVAVAHQRDIEERLGALAAQVDGVSAEHLRSLDEQLSATVGEATIARIELERLNQRVGERFDTLQVRVGELEGQVAVQLDASVAVQLERLDELERAVLELDPDTLVRKV